MSSFNEFENLNKLTRSLYDKARAKDETKRMERQQKIHDRIDKLNRDTLTKSSELNSNSWLEIIRREQDITTKESNGKNTTKDRTKLANYKTKVQQKYNTILTRTTTKINEINKTHYNREATKVQQMWTKAVEQANKQLEKQHQKELKKETTKWEREIKKEHERQIEYMRWKGDEKSRKTRQVFKNKMDKFLKRMKKKIDEELKAELVREAHDGKAKDYVIVNTLKKASVNVFLERSKSEVFRLFNEHRPSKISIRLKISFEKWNPELDIVEKEDTTFFSTRQFANIENIDMEEMWNITTENFSSDMDSYQKEGSNWRIKSIDELHINISSYNPLNGSAWVQLPKWLANKQALLNMTNKDNECFKWAITRSLNPVEKHGERVTKELKQQATELNWDNINFPATRKDFGIFEKNNPGIRLMIYTCDDEEYENQTICPLWLSQKSAGHKVILFLYKQHFMPITSLSRLLNAQLGTNGNKAHICDRCLYVCYSESALENHERYCRNYDYVKTVYPEEGENTIKFINYQKTQQHPCVCYGDFECATCPINQQSGRRTCRYQQHKPTGFYLAVIRFDNKHKHYHHTGEDAADVFTKTIEKVTREWHDEFKLPEPMIVDDNVYRSMRVATRCYVCDEQLEDVPNNPARRRVRDHCHFTGKFRGIAHNECNLKLKAPKYIPVFFHNLSGYDERLFLRDLGETPGEVKCIAKNEENFISLSKNVVVGKFTDPKTGEQKDITREVRFLDSLRFMNTSLASLIENLATSDDAKFKTLKSEFPDPIKHKLLLRKGVYPYDYIDDISRLDETKLPPKSAFYSKLTKSHISDADYKHAQEVWKTFECKTMRDYHDLYMKSDVLQLADVFEEFRRICLKHYKLDPVHYYTAPGLAWDAALKTTKVELELFTEEQVEMYLMIEQGIRGGVSMISHRHAEANNKYMKKFEPKSHKKYITYLDANNLYGWAMSKPLPTGNFKWMKDIELKNWKQISNTSGKGCVLEVDLEYPEELHDKHSDYPLAPERVEIDKSTRLIPHLGKRERYVIHYEALKCYLEHGMKLTKIHKGIMFDESKWLKPYIDLNTNLRTKSTNDFEKDFFKLMNNAVFGKTMENIRNRVKSRKILSDHLSLVHLRKLQMKMNKPMYVGQAILDISKTLMYDFHYNYILKKYPNAKLLFTDTDSLCYLIQTEDFYDDIKDDVLDLFDTSNYPKGHPLYTDKNKKVIGLFKDEAGGKIIIGFAAPRAKCYGFKMDDGDCEGVGCTRIMFGTKDTKCGGNKNCIQSKKCKGIQKLVVKNEITYDDYVQCVLSGKSQDREMNVLRSHDHIMYAEKIKKVALSANDTKRVILEDGIHTLSHGHWRVLPKQKLVIDAVIPLPRKGSLGRLVLEKLRVNETLA